MYIRLLDRRRFGLNFRMHLACLHRRSSPASDNKKSLLSARMIFNHHIQHPPLTRYQQTLSIHNNQLALCYLQPLLAIRYQPSPLRQRCCGSSSSRPARGLRLLLRGLPSVGHYEVDLKPPGFSIQCLCHSCGCMVLPPSLAMCESGPFRVFSGPAHYWLDIWC